MSRAMEDLLKAARGASMLCRSLLAVREGPTDKLISEIAHFCDQAIAEAAAQPQRANVGEAQPALDSPEERHQHISLLTHAVKVIRTFHGINIPQQDEKFVWNLYYQNAPEMKPLREALEKAGVKL